MPSTWAMMLLGFAGSGSPAIEEQGDTAPHRQVSLGTHAIAR
jgi:hypothetical protein